MSRSKFDKTFRQYDRAHKSKNGKSAGPDKLPYEVLKNETIIEALHKLYLLWFSPGKVPVEWLRATISLIPKCSQLDVNF